MVDLWKGKGDRTMTTNSRGILIQTQLAKTFGGILKEQLNPVVRRAVADTQCGATKGRGTYSAGMVAELFANRCRASKKCFAMIFADLSAAFDTVCRELAMATGLSLDPESELRSRLERLNMPPSVVEEVVSEAKAGSDALTRAGAFNQLVAMLADYHECTWVSVSKDAPKETDEVVQTHLGARQGCKTGADIFNVIYELALARIREDAKKEGLVTTILYHETTTPWTLDGAASGAEKERILAEDADLLAADISEVTYVDDDLGLLDADSPAELVKKTSKLISIMIAAFQRYGLRPNLKQGKTEVMMHLCGKGAKKERQKLFDPETQRHFVKSIDGVHAVGVVNSYKHLGTIRTPSGSHVKDAKARASACLKVYTQLAGQVFGNNKISISTRLSLAESLCFSVLFSGTETWVAPNEVAVAIIHSARLRILRYVAGKARYQSSGHGTDRELLRELGRIPTDLLLLKRRLMYLPSSIVGAPRALIALRRSGDTGTGEALGDDLEWAWRAFPRLRPLPNPRQAPDAWSALINNHRRWKELLTICDPEYTKCRCASGAHPRFVSHEDGPIEGTWTCELCPPDRMRCCSSEAALRTHQARSHGSRNPARDVVLGSTCPCCKTVFSNRRQAVDHVAFRNKICKAILLPTVATHD